MKSKEIKTMNTKTAHTPTPWKVRNTRPDNPKTDNDNRLLIVPVDPSVMGIVAQMPFDGTDETKLAVFANAAFIVKAVNCHEELLDLVYNLTEDMTCAAESAGEGACTHCIAQKLIAKAEGK